MSGTVPVAVMTVAMTACAAGPDYRPPSTGQLDVPPAYATRPAAGAPATELAQWWASFDDPLLAQLVAESFAHNREIDAAGARLRAARASLNATRAAFWPTLGASMDANASEVSGRGGGATESWQAGFDAGWEVDLFGGTRRGVEAAGAELDATAARLEDVRNSIAAEVALNYIDARSAYARLRVARDNLEYQDETLQITQWRNQAGLVSAQDVEQATVQRSQTAAAIPQLRATHDAAANRLAVLTGQAPGSLAERLGTNAGIPLGPDDVVAGVPAELLRRRPDLVAAERALAAEVARIGVAEARLYPALRLGGSLRSSALAAGDLGTVLVSSLGAGLTAPLFQGGQLRAQLQGQRATADAALAVYQGVVLGALEEVENALTAIETTREREAQLVVAERSARNSALLARARYESGLTDFESLLEANRSLLTTQESRLTARAARATAAVQLFKALGGGWAGPAGVDVRP
jgi:NodT family efflux transporter outer membrane factor (OMF) lipoprotein